MTGINDDKYIWDQAWQATSNTVHFKDIFHLIDEIKLEYLLPLLPSNKKDIKIVEVGCGSARLSCFLASCGYNTTCLDYSENALEVARKNYQLTKNKGEFILGDVRDLPFQDDIFDIVLSTGLLEHFKEPNIVVNEMVRILKPGGIFYSDIVPDKFSLFRSQLIILEKLNLRTQNDEPYEKKLNKDDIIEILQSSGLNNINVFAAGIFLPPLPPYWNSSIREKEYTVLHKLKKLIKGLDDTFLAELLGFYYFAYAKK